MCACLSVREKVCVCVCVCVCDRHVPCMYMLVNLPAHINPQGTHQQRLGAVLLCGDVLTKVTYGLQEHPEKCLRHHQPLAVLGILS